MLVVVAFGIVSVERDGTALPPGDCDLPGCRGLALMLILDMGVECRVAEIALATWTYKISLVGIISRPSLSFNMHISAFHNIVGPN